MKDPTTGGFRMHEDGEIDIRASYCAVSVASLLNILTEELCEGVARYSATCQTFEGGMGGEMYNEAHGGYSFCGLAALVITNRVTNCLHRDFTPAVSLKRFRRWLCGRQMGLEGGFQGRANKVRAIKRDLVRERKRELRRGREGDNRGGRRRRKNGPMMFLDRESW